jgi:hypothetical protein
MTPPPLLELLPMDLVAVVCPTRVGGSTLHSGDRVAVTNYTSDRAVLVREFGSQRVGPSLPAA